MPTDLDLFTIVAALRKHYGNPPPPAVIDPFEVILFDCVAYLVDDLRRRKTWARFKNEIGVDPRKILKAGKSRIASVISDGGPMLDQRVAKVIDAAQIAIDECDGDLSEVLQLPPPQARRVLKKFPGVGDPGADKILMLTRTQPILALDSNCLRVLQRLGIGSASGNYPKDYRATQESIASQINADCDWLIAAHQLLRQHGQVLCKTTAPQCGLCPLARGCAYVRRAKMK